MKSDQKLSSAALTLEEKIGQLVMASLDGQALNADAEGFIKDNHISNFVHFGNNARDPEQTIALNRALQRSVQVRCGIPALIAVDHEGGRVMRFRQDVTWFPTAMALGATKNLVLAEDVGRAMGVELSAMGIGMNFAPVLDVNANLRNPVIGVRSFGDNAMEVAELGIAMMKGMQSAGVTACGKHFPGHGDTSVDSHFGLPIVDKPKEALWKTDFLPFLEAIRAGMAAIMTSHIVFSAYDPCVPATLSSRILQGLLRDEMSFCGLIVSDAMHMQGVQARFGLEQGCVEALKNGVDLICVGTGGPGHYDSQSACCRALVKAAQSNEIPMARIDQALRRVLAVKAGISTSAFHRVDWESHAALAQRVAEASITQLRDIPIKPLAGRVLCASQTVKELRFGVAEGDWRSLTFAEIAAESLGCEKLLLTGETDLSAAIDSFDTVVIGIDKPEQEGASLSLLREVKRREKRAIVILTGLPYEEASIEPDCPVLCLYGLTRPSIQAACRVLKGEITALGALPVDMG